LPKARPRTVEVEIYDQTYAIVLKADMHESDVIDLAEEVDGRMRDIAAAAKTPDSLKIAILTALHLAQELRELRQVSEQSEKLIRQKSNEWSQALEALETLLAR